MADEQNFLEFNMEYNQTEANKLKSDLAAFQKLDADNLKSIKAEQAATKSLNQTLAERSRTENNVKASLKATIQNQQELREVFEKTNNEIKDGKEALEDYKQAGDLASALKFTGGLGTVLGVGAGQYASAFGDVTEAAAQLPKLKEALKNLPQIATSAATALGPTGLGLMAAITAVTVGVTIASKAITDAIDAVTAQTKARFDAIRDVQSAVRTGTTVTEAQKHIAELQAQLTDEENNRRTAQMDKDKAYADAVRQFGSDAVVRALDTIYHPLAGFDEQIQQSGQNIVQIQQQLKQWQDALAAGDFALDTATTGMFDFKKALEDAGKAALQTAKDVIDAALKEKQRRDQVNFQYDQRELQAEEAFGERLHSIASDTRDKLEAINKQIAELPQQRANDLAAAEASAGEKRAQTAAQYMADENKNYAAFLKEQRRIAADSETQRLREIEDYGLQLLDAERSGDVLRFEQTRDQRNLELERQKQDADKANARRIQDFQDEDAQRKAAYDEKQAAIDASLKQETASIVAEYDKRRDTLLEQITSTNDAAKKAVNEAVAAFNQNIQQLDQQRQSALHNSLDYDRQQLAAETENHQTRMAQIGDELRSLNLITDAVRNIGQQAVLLGGSSSGGSGSGYNNGYGGIGSGGGYSLQQQGIRLFDDPQGFIVPRGAGGLGAFGANRGFDEAIIPLNGRGFGNTVQVNMNGDILVGEVASPEDVRKAVAQGNSDMGEAILGALEDARFSPRRN